MLRQRLACVAAQVVQSTSTHLLQVTLQDALPASLACQRGGCVDQATELRAGKALCLKCDGAHVYICLVMWPIAQVHLKDVHMT